MKLTKVTAIRTDNPFFQKTVEAQVWEIQKGDPRILPSPADLAAAAINRLEAYEPFSRQTSINLSFDFDGDTE